MASKKKTSNAKRGRPPSDAPVRAGAFHMRVKDDWKAWLRSFADHKQLSESDLVNQALIYYAKHEKFDPPPKR